MRVVEGLERHEPPARRREEVAEIIRAVREGGDGALVELTERFDGVELRPEELRVNLGQGPVPEPALADGLATAIENVRTVAEAQLRGPTPVDLAQGQRVEVHELPVRRAGIYVPGGRAPYLSTVVMCAVTARVAGVDEIAVCSPGAHPVVIAACEACEVDEVYGIGGAQAIAALAHGTESVASVDVIVGPGSSWVTEAKRQVFGRVGIDGLAGPSELVVIAAAGADPELVALDLLAQAEHGPDSVLALIALDRALLDSVVAAIERMAPQRPSATDAELRVLQVPDARAALREAERLAPEHLQLMGAEAEELAGDVRRAGCLFIGQPAATAFGDYVAGSNHVLPTGGAARFQSALSVSTFRRRMARVSLPGEAPRRLAPAGAALARAEGFPVHAESMERRA